MMLFAEGIDVVWALGMLLGAGGVIALLFRQLISSKDDLIKTERARADAAAAAEQERFKQERTEKDREITDLQSKKKSWQEVADEAAKATKQMADFMRMKEGKPPIVLPAPVVSESHSPSTAKQREEAAIATVRATMAQIKLETGLEPRPEPERAVEPLAGNPVAPIQPAPPVQSVEVEVKKMVVGEMQVAKMPEK